MAVFTAAAVAGILGVASTSFLATVSAFALNAAVGIGLNLAVQALNKADQPQVAGVRGKMQSGGDVARSFLMGARATAGSLVYANTWGRVKKTPNAYLTQVIALSDVPISGVTAMWVNGSPVTVNTADTSHGVLGFPVTEYGNHLWVKFYDGTQTVADPLLVGTVSSASRPYQSTRVGRGCAYAIVTSQVNNELFSGFPSFRFEVAGMPLYDPSKDSSIGGVGPHRWSNRATWGGDGDNFPAVQVYNLLRGISYDGSWLYGLQNLSAARIPVGDCIAQINKCRALVSGPSGPEPQYLTGIEISVDTELSAAIDAILKGAHGRLIEVGGLYKLQIGAPAAPVLTFSDQDILSTEQQKGKPFASLANSINGITASYPEPMEAWNTKPAPALFNSDFETRDGKRRLIADLQLETVSRNSQVQRIMAAALAEARRERRHTFTLPPFAWALEPGDVVAFGSTRNGYADKQFRVEGVGDKANLDVLVDIIEVDPTDYDYGAGYIPPTFSPLDPVRPGPSIIDGWSAEPWTIADASGAPRRPAIKVSAAPDLNDVLNVHVVARVKDTGAIVFDSVETPYAEPYSWILSGNWCLPATVYQVKGKEIPYSGRQTEFSEWIDVLTPNVLFGSGDVLDGAIIAAKIATGAIIADKIFTGAVTSLKLADAAVTTAKIALAAVISDNLANNSVITSKLADAAITGAKLAAEAIDATKFASSIEPVTIVTAGLPTTRLTASISYLGKLYRWNGTAYVIGAAAGEIVGQITSTQIADDAITTPKIAANAITAAEIDAFAVTAGKVAAGAISTAELAAGAITTAKLAAGVITTDKLAVGSAVNQIPNADFSAGTTGWAYDYNTGGTWLALTTTLLNPTIKTYGIPTGSLSITQTTDNVGIVLMDVLPVDPATGSFRKFTVAPGKKYELSVYSYGHRCAYTRAHIGWLNTAGVAIAYDFADAQSHQNGDPQQNINNYARIAFMAVAPAGAVAAQIFFRINIDTVAWGGTAGNWTWLAQPYFGEAQPNQTQPSAWNSGATTLISSGNIVTGAIVSDKIATEAIVAGKIAAGAITAVDIAASTITGSKIAANTIGATNIAAMSITSKHLLLTDYTNLVPNGYFESDDLASNWGVAGPGIMAVLPGSGGFGENGGKALLLQKNAVGASDVFMYLQANSYIPVQGGGTYYFEAAIKTNQTPTSGGFFFRVWYLDANKVDLGINYDMVAGAAFGNNYTKYSGKWTVHPNARYVTVHIYNNSGNTVSQNLIVDRLIIRKANAAELIVDGSIIAQHISVTSLSAISANLGSVNISNAIIGTLTVGTSNIQAGAVTGYTTVAFSGGDIGAIDGSRDVLVTLNHPDPAVTPGLVIRGDGWCSGSQLSSASGSITCSLLGAGANFAAGSDFAQASAPGRGTAFGVYAPAAGTTSTVMTLRCTNRGTLSGGFAMFQVFKK
ncbi:phage tail protein [Pararhizobium sp. DWP3-4]|uniref:phage tail protein n=1 Tax=Pararhizobium sp. DWP3-4 TaxID=2804565 RepID=UPI003CEFE64C